MIRDQALSVSGLLVEKLGGPSVLPYQPAGLWKELGDADFTQDHGESLYRRSLYTFWKRTVAPPAMITFDAAGRESCRVLQTRTNTPLQALTLDERSHLRRSGPAVGRTDHARRGQHTGRATRFCLSTRTGENSNPGGVAYPQRRT